MSAGGGGWGWGPQHLEARLSQDFLWVILRLEVAFSTVKHRKNPQRITPPHDQSPDGHFRVTPLPQLWHGDIGTLALWPDAPCDPPFSSQSAHTCASKSRAWQTLTGTHSESQSHDFFQFQRKRMAARLAAFRINKPAKFKHEGSVLDVSLLLVNNICMFLMKRLQIRRQPWSNMQDCEGCLTSRFKPLCHLC